MEVNLLRTCDVSAWSVHLGNAAAQQLLAAYKHYSCKFLRYTPYSNELWLMAFRRVSAKNMQDKQNDAAHCNYALNNASSMTREDLMQLILSHFSIKATQIYMFDVSFHARDLILETKALHVNADQFQSWELDMISEKRYFVCKPHTFLEAYMPRHSSVTKVPGLSQILHLQVLEDVVSITGQLYFLATTHSVFTPEEEMRRCDFIHMLTLYAMQHQCNSLPVVCPYNHFQNGDVFEVPLSRSLLHGDISAVLDKLLQSISQRSQSISYEVPPPLPEVARSPSEVLDAHQDFETDSPQHAPPAPNFIEQFYDRLESTKLCQEVTFPSANNASIVLSPINSTIRRVDRKASISAGIVLGRAGFGKTWALWGFCVHVLNKMSKAGSVLFLVQSEDMVSLQHLVAQQPSLTTRFDVELMSNQVPSKATAALRSKLYIINQKKLCLQPSLKQAIKAMQWDAVVIDNYDTIHRRSNLHKFVLQLQYSRLLLSVKQLNMLHTQTILMLFRMHQTCPGAILYDSEKYGFFAGLLSRVVYELPYRRNNFTAVTLRDGVSVEQNSVRLMLVARPEWHPVQQMLLALQRLVLPAGENARPNAFHAKNFVDLITMIESGVPVDEISLDEALLEYSHRERPGGKLCVRFPKYKHLQISTCRVSCDDKDIEPCTICFDTKEHPVLSTQCSHSFCYACLKRWSRVNSSCPLCKKEFVHDGFTSLLTAETAPSTASSTTASSGSAMSSASTDLTPVNSNIVPGNTTKRKTRPGEDKTNAVKRRRKKNTAIQAQPSHDDEFDIEEDIVTQFDVNRIRVIASICNSLFINHPKILFVTNWRIMIPFYKRELSKIPVFHGLVDDIKQGCQTKKELDETIENNVLLITHADEAYQLRHFDVSWHVFVVDTNGKWNSHAVFNTYFCQAKSKTYLTYVQSISELVANRLCSDKPWTHVQTLTKYLECF